MKTDSCRALIMAVMFLFCVILTLPGQGYLMLAGGSGETPGGWSDAPYAWVAGQAANKRIAVISYQSGQSDWIPDYFVSKGAVHARNFYIPDRITADLQATYDSLVSYDGIFLKGGNQFFYYDRYKDTRTEQALQEIYDRGGVLSGTSAGMAILSPIIFTAEKASVDPMQALLHAYSSQITLEDDFLETCEERYIYDTHFVQRGRMGRLPAFMATWFRERKEVATGIGVDDRTAFCIAPDQKGYVFGTGAVNIIRNLDAQNPFDTTLSMPRAASMRLTQLLHGCSIDLATGEITGFESYVEPEIKEENGRYNIMACGTDYPSENALTYFVRQSGDPEDVISIVTGLDLSRAEAVRNALADAGAPEVYILQALSGKRYDPAMKEQLEASRKILVIANSYDGFFSFVNGGGNGALLKEILAAPGSISFFAGDNARFAGHTVVERYRGFGYSSYEGSLEFKAGLGLLETSCLMPYAFTEEASYENTVSGLPYAMIRNALYHGIYLAGNSFMEYTHNEDGQSWFRSVDGSFPLILLSHEGGYAGLANQGPNEFPRNVAGFEAMDLAFLAPGDSLITGSHVETGSQHRLGLPELKLYPNPAADWLLIKGIRDRSRIQILDLSGKILMEGEYVPFVPLDVSSLEEGLYVLQLRRTGNGAMHQAKVLIKRKS